MKRRAVGVVVVAALAIAATGHHYWINRSVKNTKPIVWVEFGDWKGVWCRAEYMELIHKQWVVAPWKKQNPKDTPRERQFRAICSDAAPKTGKIRVTINGGEFVCDDEHDGPAVSMGSVLSSGQVIVGHGVIKNRIMTEGMVAFNTTGSDIYADRMENDGQDPAKAPYANSKFKQYDVPYLSLLHEKDIDKLHNKIRPLFGPYQHGKIAHFMLMNNGQVIPKVRTSSTGHPSSRSIIVVGKPRMCDVKLANGRTERKVSRDMLLLVYHGPAEGGLIDDVRLFIDNNTDSSDSARGELRRDVNRLIGRNVFSIDSVIMLDGGSSSQIHFSDGTTERHYGNLSGDNSLSPRPIPDYIRLDAPSNE